MTLLMRDYHGHALELTSAEQAGRLFDDQIATIMPHGGCGQTLTIGPVDRPTLRIDIDIKVDRAAVRWLPDGSYAAEQEADTPIIVYESPDAGLVDIAAVIARATPAQARTAISNTSPPANAPPTCIGYTRNSTRGDLSGRITCRADVDVDLSSPVGSVQHH